MILNDLIEKYVQAMYFAVTFFVHGAKLTGKPVSAHYKVSTFPFFPLKKIGCNVCAAMT